MNKQTFVRIWHSFRLVTITSSGKRANYLKKKKVFHHIGNGCTIMDRKVPLYSRLISMGDNVHLATHVLLVTHDAAHMCLNNLPESKKEGKRFPEKIGRIDIGNNVFIGSNVTILYNVKIGNNVVIGAGSVVNRDIPDNSVAVGVPAKVIGSFDDFVAKRAADDSIPEDLRPRGHQISPELEEYFWGKN